MKILIDTNILLDVLAKRHPFYASAARIWTLAEKSKISACVSAISFNNVYYILRKVGDRHKARKAISYLRDVFSIIAVDETILSLAMDSDIIDFEDAIQYYCARKARVRYLVTRNPSDFPKQEPVAIGADEFLAIISSSK